MSFSSLGLPFPWDAFMASPIRNPSTLAFPFRKSATSDGCSAMMRSIRASSSSVSETWRKPPFSTISSGVLMLRHLKEDAAADRIENALKEVYKESKVLTYDMGGRAKGSEFTDYLISKMA